MNESITLLCRPDTPGPDCGSAVVRLTRRRLRRLREAALACPGIGASCVTLTVTDPAELAVYGDPPPGGAASVDGAPLLDVADARAEVTETQVRWVWRPRCGGRRDLCFSIPYALGYLEQVMDGAGERAYPAEDWRREVANGDTCLGYREWVEHRIESEGGL